MDIWTTLPALRSARAQVLAGGRGPIGLVPTMGALHEGHLSLIRHAKTQCASVWVSIFVNPTQFGPNEDFDRYPRTLEADLAACEAAGATGVFTPAVDVMYPASAPAVSINVPDLAKDLEGAVRPGHFDGVCRVVAKLLMACLPDVAFFGRKDYQQWRVLDGMVADLLIPTQVVGLPTVYEPDGLAMSSRNRYLSDTERAQGLGLSKALAAAETLAKAGETDVAVLEAAMARELAVHGVATDYATVRDAETLGPLASIGQGQPDAVALVAGKVGSTRLLDNRAMPVV